MSLTIPYNHIHINKHLFKRCFFLKTPRVMSFTKALRGVLTPGVELLELMFILLSRIIPNILLPLEHSF